MALKLKSCSSPSQSFMEKLVEGVVAGQQVVGADDRGVATDIAGTDIGLFHNSDVGDAKFLGEIVGRRQTVAATTDEDHVIIRFRLGLPPGRCPAPVAAQTVQKK